MGLEFLQPIENSLYEYVVSLPAQALGNTAVFHTEDNFPELEPGSIAVVGVFENRGLDEEKPHVHLNYIRKEFYSLYPGNWHVPLIDLGNIKEGETPQDTYYAVKSIAAELIKQKVLLVVLGGSQDLTYAIYRGYDRLEQMVNVVAIDSRFDFGKEDEAINAHSYLTPMIMDEPHNMFSYTNLGYQTYYNSQEEIDLIEKLYFDAYRLGEISNDTTLAEPVLRDADLVSVDMCAIKSGDSGNIVKFIPNGFDGKEICILARYSGISDRVTAFGIFNHNDTRQEAGLIAQVLWYFVEGVNYRSNEYPFGSREHYIKYIVSGDEDELVFYKSDKTERWWMELRAEGFNTKLKKAALLPCSYKDYLSACNNEVPERLWKAQRKNII